MIDMQRNRIERSDLADSELIERWVVWFSTPFGLCPTLEEAIKRFDGTDINPNMAIVPTPVALSRTTYEAHFR